MAELELNSGNFDETISKGKVLVDLWAPWCGPCRMLGPIVSQIAEEHTEITVGKVNVDNEIEIAQRFGVASIPTLLLFNDGKLVNKSVGAISKADMEEFIR